MSRRDVLVVDDDPDFLDVMRAILGEGDLGFTVRTAKSGSTAIDVLEGRDGSPGGALPAFVVLDFRLPDSNAPAVLQHLRHSRRLRTIPVLVLSQANWDADASAALEAGAESFEMKPSRMRRLREILIDFWSEHGDASDRPAD
jgi:CheY-like chemotaxis protein